jgi:hypothetical protein
MEDSNFLKAAGSPTEDKVFNKKYMVGLSHDLDR